MTGITQWPIQQPDQTLYLLIEEEERNKARVMLPALYEQEGNPLWEPLFMGTPWEAHERRSPLLIQTRADSAFVRWLQQHSLEAGELRGLIIESDAEMGQVGEWARAALRVFFDGQRKGLLRFYDPFVWHRLEPAEMPEGNPVMRLHYWLQWPDESEGRWLQSESPMPVHLPNNSLSARQRQTLIELRNELHTDRERTISREAEHV